MSKRIHHWWSPETWVISLLHKLGTELQGDARIPFAIWYGIVECIGIREAVGMYYKIRRQAK